MRRRDKIWKGENYLKKNSFREIFCLTKISTANYINSLRIREMHRKNITCDAYFLCHAYLSARI